MHRAEIANKVPPPTLISAQQKNTGTQKVFLRGQHAPCSGEHEHEPESDSKGTQKFQPNFQSLNFCCPDFPAVGNQRLLDGHGKRIIVIEPDVTGDF
jgi:hypothetical protein